MNTFNYTDLVETAVKGVVINLLEEVAKNGMPGDNHFYITFRTDRDDVKIPGFLRDRYPEVMTIVLQHQFYNLFVYPTEFSVGLKFNGILYTLTIPYNSITFFSDPSVSFGLNFIPKEPIIQPPVISTDENIGSNVISLANFKKIPK